VSLFLSILRMNQRGGSLWYSLALAEIDTTSFRWGRNSCKGSNATGVRFVRRCSA
jgi:hypothetical protein